MVLSELETQSDDGLYKSPHDDITEVDLFLENCSSLYNLILDAIHDLHSKTLTWQSLEKMATGIADVGRRVAEDHPDAEATVLLRINTINSAMEQLKLRRYTTSDTESCSSRSQCSGEMRGWIHTMEKKLKEHEECLRSRTTHALLVKLMADQLALQKEIQTEGQALVNRLYFQLSSEEKSEHTDKKKSLLEAIRKRWHTVYLNSLSLQFRIEDALNRHQEDSDSDPDFDLLAPPPKRARRYSHEDDTLPFAESEYESIMDGRATVLSLSSEEPLGRRKWDSQQHDIGYSSGENSVNDAMNFDFIPASEPERTPLRNLYRTVLSDLSDADVCKALDMKNETTPLSDSMHVHYDRDSFALPDFDEVMQLLDDDHLVPRDASNESFNTQWREIRSQLVRRPRSDTVCDDVAKNSCDASSEESSDWEGHEPTDVMSKSLNASLLGSTFSLKRLRGSRKSSQFGLEASEMEASFCSTRSDLPPCAGRSLRKRLRVRRMPRSMSDGEQLGVAAGSLTPHIRVSPPRTPLSSSTRLLQQLDRDLMESHSDTAPEQSDAPAYEWDEYHHEYRENMAEGNSPDAPAATLVSSTHTTLDEDFGDHFGSEANSVLIEECRAHQQMVSKYFEAGDIDRKLLANIEVICRSNCRRLDEALRHRSGSSDSIELEKLKADWIHLLAIAMKPGAAIYSQVDRLGMSIRDLKKRLAELQKINSIDDVQAVMDAVADIASELVRGQDLLRSLKASDVTNEVAEYWTVMTEVCKEYDQDVDNIRDMQTLLRHLHGDWSTWNSQEKDLLDAMKKIEAALAGHVSVVDEAFIHQEIQLCHERLACLETVCNRMIASIEGFPPADSSPNFKAGLAFYASALEKFQNRLAALARVPTPPSMSPIATSTPIKVDTPKRRQLTAETQTTPRASSPEPRAGTRVYRAISSSSMVKGMLALSILFALAALLLAKVFNVPFGPHLTYVNGPPPL